MPPFVTVSFTVYSPGAEYTALGLCKGEEFPFPKSHDHPVGDPLEASTKLTVRGKQPEVTSAMKSATCALETLWKRVITEPRMIKRRDKRGGTEFGAYS